MSPRILLITAVLLAGMLLSACLHQPQPAAADGDGARQLVVDFEERMRATQGIVVPSSLLSLFAPDVSDADRRQRDRLLSEFASEADYSFVLTAFEVSEARCGGGECQVTVRETRDYGERSARFGRQFDRLFILGRHGPEVRLQQYRHLSRGNAYTGSLSGSEKYSGFYP